MFSNSQKRERLKDGDVLSKMRLSRITVGERILYIMKSRPRSSSSLPRLDTPSLVF